MDINNLKDKLNKRPLSIKQTRNGSELTIALGGRLDTQTSPELEKEINKSLEGVDKLIFDLEKLEYISSAGIRVITMAHKLIYQHGTMVIINAQEEIVEVFELIGLDSFLDIEE